jgi:hypothetical protein
MRSLPTCYKQGKSRIQLVVSHSHVEALSNTSTVALRVVGSDEKGTHTWGYNRATLFLGDINTRTWPVRLGKSRI